jgi:hypothetical protein
MLRLVAAFSTLLLISDLACAGQYECEFAADLTVAKRCKIDTAGLNRCTYQFDSRNLDGTCMVEADSGRDILACAIHKPGSVPDLSTALRSVKTNEPATALTKVPGLVAGAVGLGVVILVYVEKQGVPALIADCRS